MAYSKVEMSHFVILPFNDVLATTIDNPLQSTTQSHIQFWQLRNSFDSFMTFVLWESKISTCTLTPSNAMVSKLLG